MDIAIDGGTTNTRATLLREGEAVATAKVALGVRDTATRGVNALIAAVADCVHQVLQSAGADWSQIDRVIASGMLTSASGLLEVPHVRVPVGIDDLSEAVVRRSFPVIAPKPISFVPGVRTDNDMMRGEECEVYGILESTGKQGPAWILLPGSHTKLISVDGRNRIDGIQTSLAGEVLAALANHTILKASLPGGFTPNPDLEVVREGACRAESSGVLSAAFQTRIRQVLEHRSPENCAAFLTGVVIGTDILELQRSGYFADHLPIWVGGAEPLRTVYADLANLLLAGGEQTVESIDQVVCQTAAAIGARTVVNAAVREGNAPAVSEIQ